MASITFSGQLDQAMNEAAAEGNKILFIPQQTVGEVLPGAASELVVESDGSYSITLAYNTYSIYHYSDVTKKKTLIANSVVVSADTAVSTIPDLIGSTVPVTEDSVLTIQGYLTDAQDSASAASTSETNAAASESYVAGVVEGGHNALSGRSDSDSHPASAIGVGDGTLEEVVDYPWSQGDTITDPNKIYTYSGGGSLPTKCYAPNASSSNPVTMGSTPVGDSNFNLIKNKYKIAVMGDSITQMSIQRSDAWPTIVERFLNQSAISTKYEYEVNNFAVGGSSYYNSLYIEELDGNTVLTSDAVCEYNPDMIIIALGYNDCYTRARTSSEVYQDFQDLIEKLRSNVGDDCIIEIVKQYPWDTQAGTPVVAADQTEVEMTNKSIVPALHFQDDITLSGTSYKVRSNEQSYMDKIIYYTKNNAMAYLAEFYDLIDSYVASNSNIWSTSRQDIFRACRLGWHVDGLHPDENAHKLFASAILDAIKTYPGRYGDHFSFLSTARDSNALMSAATFWNEAVSGTTTSGWDRAYILNSTVGNNWSDYNKSNILKSFNNWFLPNNRDFSWGMQRKIINPSCPVTWSISGIPNKTGLIYFYNHYSDGWGGTEIDYDSTGAYHSDSDVCVYTFIPNILKPTAFASSGTYDVGFTVLCPSMSGLYDAIKIVNTLYIAND